MGQTAIKNYKKLYSQTGGDPSLPTRVTNLENNEYKITYFAEISSSTGSITIPTGATILLDQLQGGVDAYVCTIQNGQPTGNFPQTGGGVTVDVTSFNALGAYTLSGTPSSYPVALIYIIKIKAKDYSNLDITKILDLEDVNIISQTITNGVTDKAPSEDAVFDALALRLPIEVASTTGVALTFETDRIYGSVGSPETGNISYSSVNAKVGVTNIIIHNNGSAPTFAANMKKLSGSGDYVTSVVNYIYVTYINSTEVIYSINQRT